MVSSQWSVSVVNGQSGQWSEVNSQWSVVSGQKSVVRVVSGQWSVISGQMVKWSLVTDHRPCRVGVYLSVAAGTVLSRSELMFITSARQPSDAVCHVAELSDGLPRTPEGRRTTEPTDWIEKHSQPGSTDLYVVRPRIRTRIPHTHTRAATTRGCVAEITTQSKQCTPMSRADHQLYPLCVPAQTTINRLMFSCMTFWLGALSRAAA